MVNLIRVFFNTFTTVSKVLTSCNVQVLLNEAFIEITLSDTHKNCTENALYVNVKGQEQKGHKTVNFNKYFGNF